MNNTLIQIVAQVQENYFFNEGGFHWKNKGEQIFTLRADSDSFCYVQDQCVAAIKTLLSKQSDNHTRFTYVVHEVVFHEPIQLDTVEFEVMVAAECEKSFNT